MYSSTAIIIAAMLFEAVPRMVSRKPSQSTSDFRPLPVRLLTPSPYRPCAYWSRRRLCETPQVGWEPLHFVSRMKKWRNFYSIISLRSHFEIHNNNKSFSSMSQSRNIGWGKQKPENNCQTTKGWILEQTLT